jgi:lactate dehydrogenase-like 2-hydroxyacid dehydrogenase
MSSDVVITRTPPGTAIERIREVAGVWVWPHDRPIDGDEFHARVAEARGIYCMLTDSIDRSLLRAAPNLQVVSTMAVGVDNIDIGACNDFGVVVGHTPDVLTESTADLAWAILMAASRRLPDGIESVRSGAWGEWDPEGMLGLDVSGTVLGVIGMGRIGRAIVERAAGFGMQIQYASNRSVEVAAERVSLGQLLATSDHVVVAVPLTDATRGLIGTEELAMMRPTANLVNIARGPVVDTDALCAALMSGTIRCAALDVTDPEPIPADHPLVSQPNCLIVPHIGSATRRTRIAMADLAADNLIAALTGEEMPAPYRP